MLGLPQRMEPFVSGPTLTLLSPKLKSTVSSFADDHDAAMEWLMLIGHATTSLLICEIAKIPRLSVLGAKQLSIDVNYLANILCAGHRPKLMPNRFVLALAITSSIETLVPCTRCSNLAVSIGLGLPSSGALTDLDALLTTHVDSIDKCVTSITSLPHSFAQDIAVKRKNSS